MEQNYGVESNFLLHGKTTTKNVDRPQFHTESKNLSSVNCLRKNEIAFPTSVMSVFP